MGNALNNVSRHYGEWKETASKFGPPSAGGVVGAARRKVREKRWIDFAQKLQRIVNP